MSAWQFSIVGGADWATGVDAAPTETTKRAFWQTAVPQLATSTKEPVPTPCVVVCGVTAPGRGRSRPAGPLGRAKTALDALHDDRKSGPWYEGLGARAPLVDDTPAHVCGLAVEVREGPPRTEYAIGRALAIGGERLAAVPIAAAAPNDVAGTVGEAARIDAARIAFGLAVRTAFAWHPEVPRPPNPSALVVRHWPQRDEDNTWATWIAAVCGIRGLAPEHWAAGAPLAGWVPAAVASIADRDLDTPVVYEIYGCFRPDR
jgi:hypothetical protein